jgi:hypothetical protein
MRTRRGSLHIIWLVVVTSALLLPGVASAQWRNPIGGGTFNNPLSPALDEQILHAMQKRMLESSIQAHKPAKGKAKPKHQALSKTDFKPAHKGRPAEIMFLDSLKLDTDQRRQFQEAIDATFNLVNTQLRKNNVATSYGFAIGTSLEIVTGKQSSEETDKELIAGINDQLAAAPEFTKLSVKEKQTLSDTLVLTGALLVMLHSAGEKDAAMKDASISMAKAVLTQLTGSATGS